MIKNNMFYGEPTIKEYRDMEIEKIIEEYLLTKGTWSRYCSWCKDDMPIPINKKISPKDLISSGLFVYGLKDDPTNTRAIEYYCERWANITQMWDGLEIRVPSDLWNRCNEYNRAHANCNNRKAMED